MKPATIAVLVAGVLIGGLLRSAFLEPRAVQREGEKRDPSESAEARTERLFVQSRLSEVGQRVEDLERQLRRGESAADAGTSTTLRAPPQVATVSDPPAPLVRSAVERREEQLAEFAREPFDPAWAPTMRAQIDDGLASLERSGDVHFRSRVECRSSRCVARLTWPDFKTARAEYMVADTPSTDCARSMVLDEPKDEASPVEATLIYECKK